MSAMIYTFSCPAPCHWVIKVEAKNDNDAVQEIIGAGAMNCRNNVENTFCKKMFYLPSLPEGNLRKIVRMCMNIPNQ